MVSRSAGQRLKSPATAKYSWRVSVVGACAACALLTAACGSATTTTFTTTETFESSGTIVTRPTTTTAAEKTLLDVIGTAGSGHLEVKTNARATCDAKAFDGSGHDISGPDLTGKQADANGTIVWEGELVKQPTPPPQDTTPNSASSNTGTFRVHCASSGRLPATPATASFTLA